MKIWIILMVLVITSTVVFADDVLKFENVKVYIDDKSIGTFEEGDDIDNVFREKTLSVKIKIKNYGNFPIRDVYVVGDIDNMDVNSKESSGIDLSEGSTTYRYLTWTIPDDADYDMYDLNIQCRARNVSDSGVRYTDNATIYLDVTRDNNIEIIDKSNGLYNLTTEIKSLVSSVNETAKYYSNIHEQFIQCIDAKSMLISQKDRYQESRDDFQNQTILLKSEQNTCIENLAERDERIIELRGEVTTYKGFKAQVDVSAAEVKKAEKDLNMFTFIGIVVGVISGLWWRGRNQKQPEELDDMPEV